MKLSELFLDRYLYRDNDQDSETKDSSFVAIDSSEIEPASIPSGGAAQDVNTGNVLIDSALLPSTTINVGDFGWTQSCVFVSDDTDTVSWGGGTFIDAAGNSYAIDAGTTGNMTGKTYIYLSLLESETEYQTSNTSSDSVGTGKVLIAVAKNESDAATYNLVQAEQIVGDNILVNTIDAGKIVVGSLIVGTNVQIGTAEDAAGVTTIVGGTVTTSFVNALAITVIGTLTAGVIDATVVTVSNLTVGTNVAIGTAEDAAGVTTIIGNTIDTGYVNALAITVIGTLTAGNINASVVTVSNINATNITSGNVDAARISAVALSAVRANISTLSVLRADMGTITAGIFKVSTRITIQKSDATPVGYLGLDPDSSGFWGFTANRSYGFNCKYVPGNYFRIFMDGASTDAVIDMPSPNKIKIQDNEGNAIGRWYGRNAGFSGVGGLDLFGPMRLYTTNTPPTGASNGMMFYHTDFDEVWAYLGGSWKALADKNWVTANFAPI